MAIALTLAASVMYAAGAVLQQRVAEDSPDAGPTHIVSARALLSSGVWWAGMVAFVAGNVLQLFALAHGSLVFVESLLATTLVFALPRAAWWRKRPLQRSEWIAVLATSAAIGGLLFVGRPAEGRPEAAVSEWALVFIVSGAVILMAWIATLRFPRGVRAALLGAAGGIAFGVADALTRTIAPGIGHSLWRVLESWQLYGALAAGLVGVATTQFAFHLADLSASYPSINVLEPITGAAIGIALFDERLLATPWRLTVDIVAACVIVGGVVRLAGSPTMTGSSAIGGPQRPERVSGEA